MRRSSSVSEHLAHVKKYKENNNYRSRSEHGFRAEYWDAFSVAMCEYAASWKIKANRVETVQAWRLLVLFLVNKVKQGFELEMLGPAPRSAPRLDKKRPTTQHLSVDFDP